MFTPAAPSLPAMAPRVPGLSGSKTSKTSSSVVSQPFSTKIFGAVAGLSTIIRKAPRPPITGAIKARMFMGLSTVRFALGSILGAPYHRTRESLLAADADRPADRVLRHPPAPTRSSARQLRQDPDRADAPGREAVRRGYAADPILARCASRRGGAGGVARGGEKGSLPPGTGVPSAGSR